MRFVFFWYSDPFKKLLWNRNDVIFFDNYGWWVKSSNSRENISIEDFHKDKQFHSNFDIVKVVAELRELMPVWSRWNGKGDQYELLLREAAFQIGKISGSLEILGKGTAIFHTGVSHWMDTIICELACRIANWKQIFLYRELFADRLITLIQSKSIKDRKIIPFEMSNFNYSNSIKKFIVNLNEGRAPIVNEEILEYSKNLFLSLIYISFVPGLKSILRPIKRFIFNKEIYKKTDYFNHYQKNYFFQNQTQMIQQFSAMNYYKKNITPVSKFNLKNNKVKLILAAHFQPEATSFPEGYRYGNHIDILIEIRRLGYNEEFFYKEHPGSEMYFWPIGPTKVATYRSKTYFKQLLSLKCFFLDLNLSLYEVNRRIKNLLPITCTGTIAMQRSLMGLHTIITGEPWYKGLPGTIHISNIRSLKEIPKEYVISDNQLKVKAINFLEKKLNNRSLVNTSGIGMTESPKYNEYKTKKFEQEIFLLLNKLKKL